MVGSQAQGLGKYCTEKSTNPRRLVKDIVGYGEKMKFLPPQMHWGKDNKPIALK